MRTPGPYRIDLRDVPTYGNALILGKGGAHVATAWGGNKPNMQTVVDNANLLGNALNLREALARCYGALTEEGVTDRERKQAIRMAKKVLDATVEKQ